RRKGVEPVATAGAAQLAVLAAASVVAAVGTLLALLRFLAADAQAHPRHGLAPRRWNRSVALLAARAARALRQLAARALDRILHGGVDLVLHRAIACPSGCHCILRLFHYARHAACLPHRMFRSRRAS